MINERMTEAATSTDIYFAICKHSCDPPLIKIKHVICIDTYTVIFGTNKHKIYSAVDRIIDQSLDVYLRGEHAND